MSFLKRNKRSFKKASEPLVTRSHEPRDEAEVERGLKAVYLDAKGSVPDLGKLERTSSRRLFWILSLAFICVVLAALAWTGWWVLGKKSASPQAFAVSIQGPADVSLGEEQTYELTWQNEHLQPLQDVEIRLNIPSDFTVTYMEPSPDDGRLKIWKWSLLSPRATGRIIVKGVFVGSLGGQSALQGLTQYRLSGTETFLQGAVLHKVAYTGTVLAGNLLFPERIVAGEPVQIRYVVANLGKQTLSSLQSRLTFPAGFIPSTSATSVQVDLAERRVTFPVVSLAPSTFFTAQLQGTFASGVSGDAVFDADTGRHDVDGSFLVAARSSSRVAISPGDLVLRLVVNGTSDGRSIEPGEPLRAALTYENVSGETVRDVQITFQTESVVNGVSATGTSLLQWSRVEDVNRGASTTRARFQTLSYDKKQLPALQELAPRAQGLIEVGWPTLGVASGTKDALIRVIALARMSVSGEKAPRIIRSQPIVIRYRSDADLTVESRYFSEEGAPLGSGSLPPVVGKTTTYRIYWRLQKTLHELRDVRVTASLPGIAAWTGKTSAEGGVLAYDPASRRVVWSVPQLSEKTNELEAWFEVALTPQAMDAGRFAALLTDTSFQAQDAKLDESLTRSKPALTTDLSQDEGARGKGVVRKE